MKKTKVAIVLPYFGGGGAEKMVAQLAAGMDGTRFQTEVFCVYGQPLENHLERMIADRGVPIHFIGKKKGFSLKAMVKLFRGLDAFRPDVVHTHLYACVYTAPWPVLRHRAWLHTFHLPPELENRRLIRRILSKILVRMRAMIPVAISHQNQMFLRDYFGLTEAQIPVVYNPVELKKFTDLKKVDNPSFTFITAGRFSEQKNQAMMLRAFAGFLKTGGDARLVLLGKGELEAQLRSLAQELGIAERVEFAGFVENVQDHLANADVFVLSSDYEALPLAVLEAMAAGLPIVATDVGGLRDIVTDNGILLPAADLAAMTDAMVRLYSDSVLRRKMGQQSKTHAADYDISQTVAGYCRLYDRFAGMK